jgi:hypothetical protein
VAFKADARGEVNARCAGDMVGVKTAALAAVHGLGIESIGPYVAAQQLLVVVEVAVGHHRAELVEQKDAADAEVARGLAQHHRDVPYILALQQACAGFVAARIGQARRIGQ